MKTTIIIKFDIKFSNLNFPLSTVTLIYRKSCINNNKQTERDQDKFFGRRGSSVVFRIALVRQAVNVYLSAIIIPDIK